MFEGAVVDDLQQCLAAAGRGLAGAARFDATTSDRRELCEAALELERLRRLLDAAQGRLLAEIHGRNLSLGAHALRTSRWLARDGKLPAGVARKRVSTAVRVHELLPDVAEAQAQGRIGFDHARVFADAVNERNADALDAASARFVAAADHTSFDRWRRDVRAFADAMDPDGAHDPAADLLRNRLTLSRSNGFALLRGEYTEEYAVVAEELLEAKADELFHRFASEREQFPDQLVPPRATLRALAWIELALQGQGVDPDSTRGPRTAATVVVHADHAPDDPANPPETEHGSHVVTTAAGARVSRSVAELICCDARHRVLTATPHGVVWDQSEVHDPNRAQRRAVRHRDGGCTFPGCGARPRWCDVHHVVPWPEGPTTSANLTTLCRLHHGYVHRHGWTVVLTGDGWTRWTSPGGTTRWGQRHGVIRAGPVGPQGGQARSSTSSYAVRRCSMNTSTSGTAAGSTLTPMLSSSW